MDKDISFHNVGFPVGNDVEIQPRIEKESPGKSVFRGLLFCITSLEF